MEQRNEMLKQMRLTRKERRGEVQHIIARSFSRRQLSIPRESSVPRESSPPKDIQIPVPKITLTQSHSQSQTQTQTGHSHSRASEPRDEVDLFSIGELSTEPRVAGMSPVPLDTQEEEEEEEEGGWVGV